MSTERLAFHQEQLPPMTRAARLNVTLSVQKEASIVSTMADTEDLVNAQGRNTKAIFCRHCGSQFISEDKAERVEHDQSKLHFQKLANASDADKDKEMSPFFWKVPDVWDFDNIAQTRKVSQDENEKPNVYLLCSDCEKEPVAVRWSQTDPFYIAEGRVVFERPDGAPVNGALPVGMSEEYIRSLIALQEQQQKDRAEE